METPARTYSQKRNVENPELYAVFPYRIHGLGNPPSVLSHKSVYN